MEFFRVQCFAWFNGGHTPLRQSTECLNPFTHFLRESGPRILRSIFGVFALPEEYRNIWLHWETTSRKLRIQRHCLDSGFCLRTHFPREDGLSAA